jgi:hypothetical protein
MYQVKWLALVGLSLVLRVLVLVHFTFLGTLLVRYYRREKEQRTNKYTSIHKSQTFQHSIHTIKEYQKQTSLESKQDFIGF